MKNFSILYSEDEIFLAIKTKQEFSLKSLFTLYDSFGHVSEETLAYLLIHFDEDSNKSDLAGMLKYLNRLSEKVLEFDFF